MQQTLSDQIKEYLAKKGNVVPARVDSDRTAKPLTRIIHHPKSNICVGVGMPLVNPEYEGSDGQRMPLNRKSR